ncbi:hypothetical protein [Legionella impletisoli]|uniref:Integral membrane protein (PIN domain superfamily) n=1 Tax=Legionella impletisoli TaxID=343510 RepID=A0A917JSD8_9GAMM|nr:hypothetical protein [Legionella impletisoli]GGI81543.1 hypothetical protein GCM10007966_07500 [Legionella impletisoli]
MFGALFHTFVLSQMFGLYLVIMAIIMVSRTKYYRDLILRLDPFDPAIAIGASYGLMLGILLVVIHNIWAWEPRLVVTILSWVILIKSVLWLSFPVKMSAWAKKVYLGPGYYVLALVMVVVGVFLLTKGFYLYIPNEHMEYTLF